jgi:hypothetical protein
MSCYLSSNENRFYAGLEQSYGEAPTVASQNRLPAVKLSVKHTTEKVDRRDKVGGRSFAGLPTGLRRKTDYQLRTYLTAWNDPGEQPGYGPLFRAAMGAAPRLHSGAAVAAGSSESLVRFGGSHNLLAGQAVSINGELRFVSAVVDGQSVELNAPLSAAPVAGDAASPTITYSLGKSLPSASIFDYWSPEAAVQRILCGAVVDEMKIVVNSDFHEFHFAGQAQDLIDNVSFNSGQGKLTEFPAEPTVDSFDYSIVPGHMGQVWLGVTPERFYTLTSAELSLDNGLDFRNREFGSSMIRCVAAGVRNVNLDFELYGSDEESAKALYQASKQRSAISAMFQLGERSGQLFGAYLKSVAVETPQFDDSETRLRWRFSGCRAQGSADDELIIAFG